MHLFEICMNLIGYPSRKLSYMSMRLALYRIGLSAIRPEFWADRFSSKAYFFCIFIDWKVPHLSGYAVCRVDRTGIIQKRVHLYRANRIQPVAGKVQRSLEHI